MRCGAASASDGENTPMTRDATTGTQRLFLACDLPADVAQAVVAWQTEYLRPHGDLRVNHALHITLCFLGATPHESVESIISALREVRFSEIAAGVAGPLFLPEHGRKRVVALAIADPSGVLASIQSASSAKLAGLGVYEPEKRAYLPHLTVARFRAPGSAFSLQNVNVGGFGLAQMTLYNSVLERAGAVHTPLAVFPASLERSPRGQG
jgi:2'-5' RNA ligase